MQLTAGPFVARAGVKVETSNENSFQGLARKARVLSQASRLREAALGRPQTPEQAESARAGQGGAACGGGGKCQDREGCGAPADCFGRAGARGWAGLGGAGGLARPFVSKRGPQRSAVGLLVRR